MASPRGASTGSSERGFVDDPSVFIPEPGQSGIPSVRAASKLLRWLVNEQDDEGNPFSWSNITWSGKFYRMGITPHPDTREWRVGPPIWGPHEQFYPFIPRAFQPSEPPWETTAREAAADRRRRTPSRAREWINHPPEPPPADEAATSALQRRRSQGPSSAPRPFGYDPQQPSEPPPWNLRQRHPRRRSRSVSQPAPRQQQRRAASRQPPDAAAASARASEQYRAGLKAARRFATPEFLASGGRGFEHCTMIEEPAGYTQTGGSSSSASGAAPPPPAAPAPPAPPGPRRPATYREAADGPAAPPSTPVGGRSALQPGQRRFDLTSRAAASSSAPVDAVGRPIRLKVTQVGYSVDPASWGERPVMTVPPFVELADVTRSPSRPEISLLMDQIFCFHRDFPYRVALDCHGVLDTGINERHNRGASTRRVDQNLCVAGFAGPFPPSVSRRWIGVSEALVDAVRSMIWCRSAPAVIPWMLSFAGDPEELFAERGQEQATKSLDTRTLIRRTADAYGRWCQLGGFYEVDPYDDATTDGAYDIQCVNVGFPLSIVSRRLGDWGKAATCTRKHCFAIIEDNVRTCSECLQWGILAYCVGGFGPNGQPWTLSWLDDADVGRVGQVPLHPQCWEVSHHSVLDAILHFWHDVRTGLFEEKLVRLRTYHGVLPARPLRHLDREHTF